MRSDSPQRGSHVVEAPGADGSDPSKFPANPPPLVMPGSAEQISRETAAIGVEGRPADPKTGPGSMLLGLAGVFVVLVIVSVVVGMTMSWTTGLVVLGVGCLGLVFNPVVLATLMRARDKQDIVDGHRADDARAGLR